MKTTRKNLLFVALLGVVGCLWLGACNKGHQNRPETIIEHYTGRAIGTIYRPASIDNGAVTMRWSARLAQLEFDKSVVTFRNTPIDFHGKEAQFLNANYSGTLRIGTLSGPGLVDVIVRLNEAGPVKGSSEGILHNVKLGPNFSKDNLDVILGAYDDTSTTVNWDSNVVPELNGQTISSRQITRLVAFDALSGSVETTFDGVLFVSDSTTRFPIALLLGSFLVAAGVILAIWSMRWRSFSSSDRNVNR